MTSLTCRVANNLYFNVPRLLDVSTDGDAALSITTSDANDTFSFNLVAQPANVTIDAGGSVDNDSVIIQGTALDDTVSVNGGTLVSGSSTFSLTNVEGLNLFLDDGEGNVRGMRCIRFELGEPDDSGRRRPVPIEGSEFELEVDTVVYAIGTDANPIIGQTSDIALNRWGFIATDENLATSIPGVYAGGDIVTGGATVILAMGAGRKAARAMKQHLGIS